MLSSDSLTRGLAIVSVTTFQVFQVNSRVGPKLLLIMFSANFSPLVSQNELDTRLSIASLPVHGVNNHLTILKIL